MSLKKKSKQDLSDIIQTHNIKPKDHIRILFVPDEITERNIHQVSKCYAHIKNSIYDTIVIAETCLKESKKEIPMPSFSEFKTPFGSVAVNDQMRNEFCDEDDDFYIDDHAFDDTLSLFGHLMMLQAIYDSLQVVSIQICVSRPAIIREFAYVMSEIMDGRNTLLIIPCSLTPVYENEFAEINRFVQTKDHSNLFNLLNSDTCKVSGISSFMGGILVADAWDLNVEFIKAENQYDSLIAGFATRLQK